MSIISINGQLLVNLLFLFFFVFPSNVAQPVRSVPSLWGFLGGSDGLKRVRHYRVTNTFTFMEIIGLLGGSNSKESACNTGKLGMIAGLGRSPEEGMATHISIAA